MPLTSISSRVSDDRAAPQADAGGCAHAVSPGKEGSRPAADPTHSPSTSPTRSKAGGVHRSLRLHVGVLSKSKGVRYNADGHVVTCRFCEILRVRDEQFLYEDDSLVVFRPLRPIVPSHILIVPRAHIRNVNQLTVNHVDLVRRMRAVAEQVLRTLPQDTNHPHKSFGHGNMMNNYNHHDTKDTAECSTQEGTCCGDEFPALTVTDLDDDQDQQEQHHHSHHSHSQGEDEDYRFAFHVPPFNSIDHVHMHAFGGSTGYFGRIKYRTKSWWCRSYDEVISRLEQQAQGQQR